MLNPADPAQKPIDHLIIRDQAVAGGHSRLSVFINPKGDLVLDGCDTGKYVQETMGDDDYEFSETVHSDWKFTVLLHLMKERFASTSEFQAWCKARGIPSSFWSWR